MKRKYGFTLIELLVVVAIIAVLVALLLPAITQARELAQTTVCGTRLKQLGMGIQLYTQENHGIYPPFYVTSETLPSWQSCTAKMLGLQNEAQFREAFHCPKHQVDSSTWVYWCSYGGNCHLGVSGPNGRRNIDDVPEPHRIMLLVDTTIREGWNCINIWAEPIHPTSLYKWLAWRHPTDRGFNVLFCDQHVQNLQMNDYLDFQRKHILP